jgi:hypothetical protein
MGETFDAERSERLSNWAERLESLSADAIVLRGDGKGSGRTLLEAALGSAEAVDEAIGSCSMDECCDTQRDEAFDETAYLLSNPLNARRLAEAVERLEDQSCADRSREATSQPR